MQNRGLSVFVVFVVSLASVFVSSNFFSVFDFNAQYEYSGQVIAFTNTGVELEDNGEIISVELSADQKGQLYVLEMVAISEGEVFPVEDVNAGFYDNSQIVTSTGVVNRIEDDMVIIDDETYLYKNERWDLDVTDTVYFEFFKDGNGNSQITNVYKETCLVDIRVETISRSIDGCMVLNNLYVINENTDLNIDIRSIDVLDNCQIVHDENNNITILRNIE